MNCVRLLLVFALVATIPSCTGVIYKDQDFSGDMRKQFPTGSSAAHLVNWIHDEGYEQTDKHFPSFFSERREALEAQKRCWRNSYAVLWVGELYRIVCFLSDDKGRIKELIAEQTAAGM